MNDIIPIFKTDGSISKSIISAYYDKSDKDKDKVSESGVVSIFSIVKTHKLKKLVVIDDSFISFPSLYTNLSKDCELIYGISLTCCKNALDKSEASLKTEHKISVLMKSGAGYKDLLRLHNFVHTNQDYFYYKTRIDFDVIKKFWTDNLLLVIPPYDNFIHQNLLFDSICIPDFGAIKPIMTWARMNLPYDYLLEQSIKNYASNNNYDLQEVHPVYYYKDEDVKAFMNYKCIENRSVFSKPELEGFCSRSFSFESYCRKTSMEFNNV